MVLSGNGTVGYWTAKRLAGSRLRGRLSRIVLVDSDRIEPRNGLTCPEYRGHEGRPKSERLAELLCGPWSRGRLPETAAVARDVEDVNWQALIPVRGSDEVDAAVVIAGLDDWNSRLNLCAALRAGARSRVPTMLVQIGIDRDQAAAACLTDEPDAPCPACGMSYLPEKQPCVILRNGRSLRGDLHAESRAAARLAERMCAAFAAGSVEWLNTKSNLYRKRGTRRFRRLTRPCRAVRGCWGPHGGDPPLGWNGVLDPMGGVR